MTTKLIVASMFCVASLFAACGAPGDATSEVEAAPPPAHEDESAWGVRRAGDVVEASLGSAARGERELSYPRATFLRPYFGSLALERGTRLVLEGSSGEQATLTAANNGEGVWGPSLAGDLVKLRLERDAPGDLGSYAVAKVGVGTALPDPELPDATGAISSVCGANDTVPAACFNTPGHPLQNASVYNASRAVGRMLFAKSGSMLYCTGWLISNTNLFLTNSHCLNKPEEAETLEVTFNFQNTTCTGTALDVTKKTSRATLVQTSAELDFSLLSLPVEVPVATPNGPVFNPAATFGFIQLDPTTDVRVGNEIYVPQHPNGNRKAVAFLDSESGGGRCRVTAVNVDRPGDAPGANIGYKCDTDGGSSGSPVLSTATHRAVALHHAGGCNNLGIAIRHIYPKIQGCLENNNCVPVGPPSVPINSCQGRCNQQAPSGCWCDTQCVNYGDCCADRVQACTNLTPTNSCQGRCDSQAPAGCWCHPTCFAHGDCCADMATFCQ